ncbi:hypothetical protein CRENBAI_002644 [Crenichthys baileyi]|uniref:Uncharacterized protein n=1 Tax=Crenichthys baileyi TaxID=28760 RepID=A0AAV9QV25_9TELE
MILYKNREICVQSEGCKPQLNVTGIMEGWMELNMRKIWKKNPDVFVQMKERMFFSPTSINRDPRQTGTVWKSMESEFNIFQVSIGTKNALPCVLPLFLTMFSSFLPSFSHLYF